MWCLGEPVLVRPRLMEASPMVPCKACLCGVPWALPSALSQSMRCHIAHRQTPPPRPSGKNLGIDVTLRCLPKEGCITQTARRTQCCPKQRGGSEAAMPQLGKCSAWLTAHGHRLPTSNTSYDAQGGSSNPTVSIFLATH